jgi:uncharacterized repeat protein (TIGR02543 family)
MKRFCSFIISLILILCLVPSASAEGLSDALPALEPFTEFSDLGRTRAVLFDLDTGEALYSRNGDSASKPGSLTVIMTALLLIENTPEGEWDDPIPAIKDVGTRWSRRGASMGLEEGETPTRRDLLYGLMLAGAADAAYVSGELIYGSEADFITAMNNRARELGLDGTHFDNGFGMGSNDHYTCANDMARLTFEAMKQPMFASAASAQSFTCSQGAHGAQLGNTNTALASSGCIGVKSGSDSDSEHCVIVASEAGRARLCAVVLSAPSGTAAYSYAERLISSGLARYITGTGLRPFSPADALVTFTTDSALSKEPGSPAVENVRSGETLHAAGASGSSICVYRRGDLYWADRAALELCCYADDVFIENGEALSSVREGGERTPYSIRITSRHEIKRVTLTLSLFDGSVVAKREISPCAHGVIELSDCDFTDELDRLTVSDGLYICTVEVEAEAHLWGFEPATIIKRNTSMLAVGTGGACVSYNANRGSDAPIGECFFGGFHIPLETPVRAGHVFSHWNTLPDGSGESFSPGDTVEAQNSLTLYAIWQPGADAWEKELRAGYESSLMLEGFVKNTAGITSFRLVLDGGGSPIELKANCLLNEAQPGEIFLAEPITLPEGSYELKLFGSSAGSGEELLLTEHFTVSGEQAATPTPEITEAPASTGEPEPEPDPFSLAGLPIWVWFLIGAVVVAVLIAIIVRILKSG